MPKNSRSNYTKSQDPALQSFCEILKNYDSDYLGDIIKRLEGPNFESWQLVLEGAITGRPANPEVAAILRERNILPPEHDNDDNF